MVEAEQLVLFSECEYEHKAPSGYPVSCPTLDLSATWDGEGRNILVYRPPGQTVSKIHQVSPPGEKAPEALAATWKPDGQFLAVGWSDGFVRLMGLENNKAAHHIRVSDTAETKITHIGWAYNTIVDRSLRSVTKALNNGLIREGAPGEEELASNLPRELTFLEVDTALPKISPLPSASAGAGEDAMVFTLRTGIDFLFKPPKPEEYDQVNVMIVGTSDGNLQLNIYDSFIIGSFKCPAPNPSVASQLIQHASHPQISTHALLIAEKPLNPEEVHLVPMDLPFISSSPINLSLLASKLTTLQKLLRYLDQTQLHMQVEWKNTRELPGRFLKGIVGDLEEMPSGPRGIVPALYHIVVTGHAPEPVREWLVESLAERGHKRWDKAVVSGLEGLRSLVHENFLPALDRCTIILSRLRGLAQFYDSRDDIGFSVAQISRAMDIIGCLSLVGNKILVEIMGELECFTAFSTWLRFQIDRLASSSTANEELTEKEATMDNSKVLTYIERYLTNSPLRVFFDDVAKEDYAADWAHVEDGPRLLDVLDAQLKKHENGQQAMKALPHVDFLVDYLATCSSRIFKGIAEAKKRSVRFGKPIKITVGHPISQMDVRMCRVKEKDLKIYTVLASKETEHQVHVFCAGIYIINGISSNYAPTTCTIDFGTRQVTSFKFLDDETLIVLCSETGNVPTIIRVPLHPDSLAYTAYDPTHPLTTSKVSADDFVTYTFPEGLAVRPVRMEVHEKSSVRGGVPARICLLESNRTTLRSFSVASTS
ncbi:hypothetical protein G7046_g4140 [Stylonectria norvegica]|nr:hypothetical protein G7046_g4140 [Stylonectria norvegica]